MSVDGKPESNEADFLAGGGEMGARMRERDWSTTPLGPARDWPQSLKTAVRIMLTSRQAMFVWWGPQLINLYNDAYKSIVGGKHPVAFGQPASEVWREIWEQVGPRAASVMRDNEGTYDESLLLIMERNGYPEETYYTFSYSPVPGDEGGTGGIICANTDDTRRIIGERQLLLLTELAAGVADARSVEEACVLGAQSLAADPHDIPFAMIYLHDAERGRMVLTATCGIDPEHPAAPLFVEPGTPAIWPIAEVHAAHEPRLVTDLGQLGLELPSGAWHQPPDRAALLPIASSGATGRWGLLIVGLNPFRMFDEGYRGFLDLVSGQIAAGISNAQAYDEERKRAEALAELDRAKTTFFSNVSHEFRTPLTLMLGPLDELLGASGYDLDLPSRELLSVARRNGQRLLKLVNTLLDFSRIEAGRTQAVYVPVDLAGFTADLASVFRAAVEKAGMRLVIDCPPLSEPVWVDRDMWEKIVLNLISNAFKYTLAGEIRVILRADAGRVLLTVADTGIGIPSQELPNIFTRFHRVEGAQGRTHEGTGIGLSLVRELAQLHGGAVSVESEYGRGSAFTVAVPLGTAHLPADRIGGERTIASTALGAGSFIEEAFRWLPESTSEMPWIDGPVGDATVAEAGAFAGAPSEARAAAPKATILLADDNADMRDYVRRLLAADYDVIAVADGREALQAAVARRPDLVLTDVMMPNLDGFGLLRALRADPATGAIPVIMLSARAGEEARVEGLVAEADDYLIKPFSARELLARVSGILALARVRHEAAEVLSQSEERFRLMADNAPVMVWVTDADGTCVFLSKSWYEFTGQMPGEGMGTGWSRAVHPDDRDLALRAFLMATERRQRFFVEYRLMHRDGSIRWAIDTAIPHFDHAGNYLGHIGSVLDITDRKIAEEALKDADRRKDEFLATLAHELRNPLAPLRSGLELLRMIGSDDPGFEEIRSIMERQLGHMVRLIDDLLDVSRISRNRLELRPELTDLSIVLRSALETSRPLIESARHHLTIEIPPEPIPMFADVTRMAQVFANLLNNAAKYTEQGGEIRVRADLRGDHVVVSVADNGAGIPEEMLPRVFDMFTQVEGTIERAHGGLGIGLTIVERLVEMHGGTVTVTSGGLGRGSEFTVMLPLASSRPEHAAPVVEEMATGRATDGLRVLVVDDNRDAAHSLSMVLRRMGSEIRVEHDGPAALAAAEEFEPDVILLDIGMPQMSGYEVARRLRQYPWGRSVTIVALTGWGQEEDRNRSREAGFDHHLLKPVEPATLRRLLSEMG